MTTPEGVRDDRAVDRTLSTHGALEWLETMTKKSTLLAQLTKRRAKSRLRQLLDEMHMLMGAFPDLRDAFDPDELPVAFILKRDSARAGREFKRPRRLSARPRKQSSGG